MRVFRPLTLWICLGSSSLAASVPLTQVVQRLEQGQAWQNLDLTARQAAQNVQAAQAGVQPRVTLGGGYTASGNPNSDLQQSGTVNLGVSLPVLPWASAFQAIKTAERNARSTLLDVQDSQNALKRQVIEAYFALQLAQMDLQLARTGLDQASQQLVFAGQQQALGQLSAEGLLQARQKETSARLNLQKAEASLLLGQATLQNLLGGSLPEGEFDALPEIRLPEQTLEAWVTQGLANRSDVQKAKLRVEGATSALQQARENRTRPGGSVSVSTSFADGFSVEGSLNWQTGAWSSTAGYSTAGGQGGYRISLSASIPLVDGTADAEIQTQQLNQQGAVQNLQLTEKNAVLDIQQKFSNHALSTVQLASSQQALDLAQAHLTVVQARLEAGLVTQLDLSTAQLALEQAHRDLRAAGVSALKAALDLWQAAGQTLQGEML